MHDRLATPLNSMSWLPEAACSEKTSTRHQKRQIASMGHHKPDRSHCLTGSMAQWKLALFSVHTHLFLIRAIYSTHAVRCRIKCQRFRNYIAFPMGLFVRIGTSLFGFVLKFWVSPRKRAIEFYEYVFAIMWSSFCLYWQNRLVSC